MQERAQHTKTKSICETDEDPGLVVADVGDLEEADLWTALDAGVGIVFVVPAMMQ